MGDTRTDARILYQDDHIVAAYKPYGVLSEAHESQPNMPDLLQKNCGCAVYPVHRLDRTTEGLMVYAKTKEAASALSEAIRCGRVEKVYLAAAEGRAEEADRMTDLLYFDRKRGKSYVVGRERRGVKEARLRYERLNVGNIGDHEISLVRIHLETGRTHQIRVQFASRKMPLVGDRRYGSRIPAENIALCACELTFPHPLTGETMSFSCEPENEIFRSFTQTSV